MACQEKATLLNLQQKHKSNADKQYHSGLKTEFSDTYKTNHFGYLPFIYFTKLDMHMRISASMNSIKA